MRSRSFFRRRLARRRTRRSTRRSGRRLRSEGTSGRRRLRSRCVPESEGGYGAVLILLRVTGDQRPRGGREEEGEEERAEGEAEEEEGVGVRRLEAAVRDRAFEEAQGRVEWAWACRDLYLYNSRRPHQSSLRARVPSARRRNTAPALSASPSCPRRPAARHSPSPCLPALLPPSPHPHPSLSLLSHPVPGPSRPPTLPKAAQTRSQSPIPAPSPPLPRRMAEPSAEVSISASSVALATRRVRTERPGTQGRFWWTRCWRCWRWW